MTGKRVPARTPYKKGQAQKYTRKKREASEDEDERPVAKKAKGKAAVESDEEDGVGAPAVLDTSEHKDKNGDTYWNVSFSHFPSSIHPPLNSLFPYSTSCFWFLWYYVQC